MKRGRVFAALLLALAFVAAAGLAGCRPAEPAPGDENGQGGSGGPSGVPVLAWQPGAFVAGQVLRYDVLVTVDGSSGTGSLKFTVAEGAGGAVVVACEGKGPGIAGAPIYDGHEFSALATLTDPAAWLDTLTASLDGGSSPMTRPLLLEWNGLFAGQPSWAAGASWVAADGSTVTFTEQKTFAGKNGMAGDITGATTASFCVAQGVPLPLYAKVTDNGVTLEYTLVEATGF